MKKRSNFSVMRKLIVLVKPLTGYMLLAVLMGLIGHLCAAFITILGGYGILHILGTNAEIAGTSSNWFTQILTGSTSNGFSFIFVLLAAAAAARGLLRYGEQACNHFIAFKLLALIRDKVFRALRKLCPAKLEGRDKGNLISVITSDIELLEVFYAHTISPAAIASLFTAVMCLFIGSYHPLLGVIALAAYGTVGIFVPMIVSCWNGREGMLFREKSGDLSGFVLDSLRGLSQTIQYNGGEKRLREINRRTDELAGHEARMKNITGFNTAITNSLILIFDLAILFCGVWLNMQGKIGFDGVLIPTLALMSSFGPVVALANLGSTLQNTFAAGNRVLDILEETSLVEEIKGKETIGFDSIKAENVTFAYEDETILDQVSLDVEKGNVIGIVGKSGSGKSTLLKLFMRFWNVEKGSILVSGKNIEEVNTSNLRDLESFVTQETHLFHDSIASNLRIAKRNATMEEIQEACKKASIHDFIMGLPQGYDTPVGELGDTLSGGERQRIGLARAFLHDAPLVLLDEPTSNLDSLNEAIILKSLGEKREGKTIILVTHRESTMRIADQVYSIEKLSAAGGRCS